MRSRVPSTSRLASAPGVAMVLLFTPVVACLQLLRGCCGIAGLVSGGGFVPIFAGFARGFAGVVGCHCWPLCVQPCLAFFEGVEAEVVAVSLGLGVVLFLAFGLGLVLVVL